MIQNIDMIQNEEYNGYFLFDDISRYKYYILSWHSLSVFKKVIQKVIQKK